MALRVKDSHTAHQNLRSLFENEITVNHIAEQIITCRSDDSVANAKALMEHFGFDCLGVEHDGKVIGYVQKEMLEDAKTLPISSFEMGEIVSETTSLIDTLHLFRKYRRIFVLEGNVISKLVTQADFQKAPVRLLLFGLVSLVELYLYKIIKIFLPNDRWQQYLHEERIEKAKDIFLQRKALNQEIELIDCLQLCDKRDIIVSYDVLFEQFNFQSKNKAKRFFRRLETLRNDIAHAQQFMNNITLVELISLVEETENLLQQSEQMLINTKEENL